MSLLRSDFIKDPIAKAWVEALFVIIAALAFVGVTQHVGL